jgi:hypothetical protein
MLKIKKFISVVVVLMFAWSIGQSQSCKDFHLGFCPIPDFTYYYNQQSQSMEFRVGEKKEVHIIAYENTDYFISICKHRKFNTLQLKLYTDDPRELIYDNATNAFADTLKFANRETRRLVLELSIPNERNDPKDRKERCAGVLIGTRMHSTN